MTSFFWWFLLSISFSSAVYGLEGAPAWTSIDVPAAKGPAATQLLEARGIPAVSWSNAVVEVSSFGGLETIPLADLEKQLTPEDPRWDPWLKALKPRFLPQEAGFRIWVEPGRFRDALKVLGTEVASGEIVPAGPRQVTGWALAAFSVLYLLLRLWAEREDSRTARRPVRRWFWLPVSLALAVLGGYWALERTGPSPLADKPGPSWAQHLWFQESWPYGAVWSDWVPGKAWTYRSYDRKAGRLEEVPGVLPAPDQAWLQAAWRNLDPHHAARIFPPPNP